MTGKIIFNDDEDNKEFEMDFDPKKIPRQTEGKRE